ncbi:MAG: right-handed parallel beta-helix repeat-containing protein [Candidatus Stygibacter australis]|nr:right-handed parallel beta-helix repeat-containing protein [Candidatus Stygibacter australis]MDP8322121.1 right-handed parallel beta-helix repeat-containing protein [Candidatus Stygibacter australis]
MKLMTILIGAFFLLISVIVYGDIIDIAVDGSGDYTSIQSGIEVASDSDTVLVAPGIYYEGIDFLEKEILVASWYFTTQDTSFISSTIIDGEDILENVVLIENLETDNTIFSGFSLRNMSVEGGVGIYYSGGTNPRIEHCHIYIEQGGGISLHGGEPVISDIVVTGTGAEWGTGIYITNSDAQVLNCRVTQAYMGLAIYYHCSPFIENCEFVGNYCGAHIEGVVFAELDNCLIAESYGAERYAFELDNESFCLLRNCTIAGNTNEMGSLFCRQISFTFLANCIVANNGVPAVPIAWSHFRYAACVLDYEIAAEEDVMLNTDWDCQLSGDYSLGAGSPCIDTGISEFEYQEDVGSFTLEHYEGISFNIEDYNGLRPDRGYRESEIPAPLHAYFYVEEDNVCAGSPLQFQDYSTGEIVEWQWDFENDGIIDSNEQYPVHIYEEEGIYSVSLQVTDENGSELYLETDLITVTSQRVHNISQNTWHSEISQGMNYAEAGDTLIIHPGIYQEVLDFQGKPLYLRSLYSETGDESYIDSTIIEPLSRIIIDDEINWFEITGFRIRNCPEAVMWIRDGANGRISHCLFENNGGYFATDGGVFYIRDAGEIEIDHCQIRENEYTYGEFINVVSDSQVKVSNTEITQNTGINCESAIKCGSSSFLQITNCTIADNEGWGIRMNNCELVLLNTIIYNCEDDAIFNDYGTDFLIFNCDIEDFEDLSVYGLLDDDEYGYVIETEPGFVDPEVFDYTLTDSSACINAGTAYFEYDGTIYLNLDESEYHGFAPDIGAYENTNVENDEEDIAPVRMNMINYPNPFNPVTTIKFTLPASDIVTLNIYNIKGQLVKQLLNEKLKSGCHEISWEGINESGNACTSGLYFLRLQNSYDQINRRILLLK